MVWSGVWVIASPLSMVQQIKMMFFSKDAKLSRHVKLLVDALARVILKKNKCPTAVPWGIANYLVST